ncbi:MAG: hypothetical protein ACOC24_01190 [Desulfovibrionales bacterium]
MTDHSRHLGVLREIVEALGLEITYAYDDLVFVSHNPFLLQFGAPLGLYFNRQCPPEDADLLEKTLQNEAGSRGVTLQRKGWYAMEQSLEEEITLRFFQQDEEENIQ